MTSPDLHRTIASSRHPGRRRACSDRLASALPRPPRSTFWGPEPSLGPWRMSVVEGVFSAASLPRRSRRCSPMRR